MKNVIFALLLPVIGMTSDLFLSPALTDNALAVSTNPAGLATYRRGNLALLSGINPESLFIAVGAVGGIGLGIHRAADNTAYYLTNGFRLSKTLFMGIRSGYMDANTQNYYKYDFGLMYRPFRFLSFGGYSDNLIHGNSDVSQTYLVGAGLKLLDFLVVNVDATLAGSFSSPRVGAEFLLGGINLVGLADLDNKSYSLGLSISSSKLETGFLFSPQKNGSSRWSASLTTDRKPALFYPKKRVALIPISGRIRDNEPEFSLFGDAGGISLVRILSQLRNAARDSDIEVVIIKLGNLTSGLGMVEEIRNAILDLRLSRKKVICYMENVGLLEYYLACAADEIVVEPMGAWVVLGVSAEITFFKGLFDKIGIKAEFVRVGKYKSAVEPLIQDTMSAAFRENETALLKSLFDGLVSGICGSRDLDSSFVVETINKGNISLKQAVEDGFIDNTGYLTDLIAQYAGSRENTVDLSKRSYYSTKWQKRDKIAVINASGTIISGESFTDFFSGATFMGAETIARILKKVKKDKRVRAVVLRLNSGGGSGVASDIIWREVQRLREKGKPVIVSIADVAASGAYYIACAADTIVCNPGAIVGSIGVYTGKFVMRGLYDKLGIKKEIIKFGENANVFSDYNEFTDEQRERIKISIEAFYDGFVDRVSSGRNLTREQVDSLGGGRVFTGIQGLENGLVDVSGGIAEAIDIAKMKAGFSEDERPDIDVYPKRRGFFSSLSENTETKISRSFVRALNTLKNEHLFAIMPFRISFR